MPINLKELSKQKDLFAPGHRACSGCGPAIAIRQVLHAAGEITAIGFAIGCMEVVSTIFPFTAYRIKSISVGRNY